MHEGDRMGFLGRKPQSGSGAEPQPGSGAGAPAGCGAEPREENFRANTPKTQLFVGFEAFL